MNTIAPEKLRGLQLGGLAVCIVSDSYGQRHDADPETVNMLRRIEQEAEIEPYGLEGRIELMMQQRRAIDAYLERKELSAVARRRVWRAIAQGLVWP